MTIARCSKAKVPQTFRRVPCLAHGAQHHAAYNVFFFCSLCFLQDLLKRLRFHIANVLNAVTKRVKKCIEIRKLCFVRRFMHAVNERHPQFKHVLCNGFICNQHKLFNHAVGNTA